jgi:hypothetical protein
MVVVVGAFFGVVLVVDVVDAVSVILSESLILFDSDIDNEVNVLSSGKIMTRQIIAEGKEYRMPLFQLLAATCFPFRRRKKAKGF